MSNQAGPSLIAAAERPSGATHGLRRQPFGGGEGQKHILIPGQMIENREMKAAIAEERGHIARVEPCQSEKSRHALFVVGEISQRAQSQFRRRRLDRLWGANISRIPADFH
ncbi:hypothetical protein SS37A_11210 [Methylocystis iwaonis]|uniref:Uncharacterized protein n=1 Tax=Methylocystis iwaonis TaxID=2885079 RepID=A0ABN6VEL4_9HYPH|nr:hypothetical protein SS37A_11210 [Methylocystis iwaonis]